MIDQPKNSISFAEFEIDNDHRRLLRNGEIVALPSKAFDLLRFLVSHKNRVVAKDEILCAVWADRFVEESNLVVQISNLRKALNETKNSPRFLITVPGKGYKFVAETDEDILVVETHSVAELTIEQQEISSPGTALTGQRKRELYRIATAGTVVLLFCLTGYFAYRAFFPSGREPVRETENAAPRVTSIAVLPFPVLNADEPNDGLELGLPEALINRLSSLRNVSIRPLSAVKKYPPENRDFVRIGKELQVDSVIEGNIQTAGHRIRLTIRLLSTETGETLWNERIDEDFTEIFAVQDRISDRVISSLQIALSEKEKNRLGKDEGNNVDAYRKYLIARHHWEKRTPAGFYESIRFYQQALDLDPTFALALSGIADSYLLIGLYGIEPTTEAFPKAQAAAEKALALDPESAEAFVSLGMINYLFRYDWKQAEEYFRRAVELKPSYSTGQHWFGLFLAMNGRTDEALLRLRQARELDPLSSSINTDVAFASYLGNQPERAIEQLETTLRANPDFPNGLNHLGMNYVAVNRFDEAIAQFARAKQLSQGKTGSTELIWAHGFAGKRDKARQLLAALPRSEKISPFELAIIYTSLGEKEKALDALERAYEERDPLLVPVKVYPPLEPLRQEPRFVELLKKMNLV